MDSINNASITNIYDISQDDLVKSLAEWKQPAYRAKQIEEWLYAHKVDTFDAMTNLPAALREKLVANMRIGGMTPVSEQLSLDGQTVKWLFRLPDGQLIESVLMEYDDGRRTACISTQAGCAMGCVFCATGQMGFARHLTHGEILEQALHIARRLERENERLSNVVLMGMGEPFHNYDNTVIAIRRLNDPNGLNIGQRHITVSTVGLVPGIRKFAQEGLQVGLAISLHAATDEERSALLPINKRYPIEEVIDAVQFYIEKTGRRVTFEWALIRGKNDSVEQANTLGRLLHGVKCHVNAIPLNPTGGYDGQPSDPERVEAWQTKLSDWGVSSTIRVRRGIDIQAGCGQLKTQALKALKRNTEKKAESEVGMA
jgi:23S rRNA (adenine2503-C2)-methyltransferase